MIVSFFLATKVKGLLIGESAYEEVHNEIKSYLENRPEIEKVYNLITLQLGDKIMVAVKARMANMASAVEMVNDINACEKGLKHTFPIIMWAFFEPDVEE